MESAEGGAGVLRRLVDDPLALREAARTALTIMHFDPLTGDDTSVDEPAAGRERCVKACYDCLLSYGNQSVHQLIDRHLVKDLMIRLAAATLDRPDAKSATPPTPQPPGSGTGSPAAGFTDWLRARDLRLPDEVDREVEGVCPDLIYRLPDGNVAVFLDADYEEAQETLRDLGWTVITIGPGPDWQAIVTRYPSVFGEQ